MLGGMAKSGELEECRRFWIEERQSVPGFLAQVTTEMFEKTTVSADRDLDPEARGRESEIVRESDRVKTSRESGNEGGGRDARGRECEDEVVSGSKSRMDSENGPFSGMGVRYKGI